MQGFPTLFLMNPYPAGLRCFLLVSHQKRMDDQQTPAAVDCRGRALIWIRWNREVSKTCRSRVPEDHGWEPCSIAQLASVSCSLFLPWRTSLIYHCGFLVTERGAQPAPSSQLWCSLSCCSHTISSSLCCRMIRPCFGHYDINKHAPSLRARCVFAQKENLQQRNDLCLNS